MEERAHISLHIVHISHVQAQARRLGEPKIKRLQYLFIYGILQINPVHNIKLVELV
jgi:hypothetical protein